MNITVIYHSADYDGLCCRAIAEEFIGEAEYIGWNHGEEVPKVPENNVLYIMDLSIEELMEHPNLIWIDHHKTAIEKYPKTIAGYRIDGVAACRLAYQWFSGLTPAKAEYVDRLVKEPDSIRLIGEYDVWDKRDANVDTYQSGLDGIDLNWPKIVSGDEKYFNEVLAAGSVSDRVYNKLFDRVMESSHDVKWKGLTFCALNFPLATGVFTRRTKPHHDACIAYHFDGENYRVSLRGIEGKKHDLSVIAKEFGGGGHTAACGFSHAFLPWK